MSNPYLQAMARYARRECSCLTLTGKTYHNNLLFLMYILSVRLSGGWIDFRFLLKLVLPRISVWPTLAFCYLQTRNLSSPGTSCSLHWRIKDLIHQNHNPNGHRLKFILHLSLWWRLICHNISGEIFGTLDMTKPVMNVIAIASREKELLCCISFFFSPVNLEPIKVNSFMVLMDSEQIDCWFCFLKSSYKS